MEQCEIDDIEDVSADPELQRVQHRDVVPNPTFRGKVHRSGEKAEGCIPGTQTIWVKTWGCGHNNSDGEYMAGLLAAYGYRITEIADEADLWLLNSCTVKNPSEDSLRNAIKKAQDSNKHVVVAGCVPQAAPGADMYTDYSIVGVQQIDRVVEVVEETLKGHKVRLLKERKEEGKKTGGAPLALPKIRKNPLIEIVPISTGCLNQCTYCKTKHARGNLGSYPVEEIVDRVRQVLDEGVREIWLSSEDTGAYGRDIGTSFPALLRAILDVMPDGTMLRAGMTNPPYILEHLDAMAEIFQHPRIYKFLHVPVQAASDRVLDVMKREYTCAEFRHVVDHLRERVQGITIATDVICGFPTETAEEFEETLQLIGDYEFAIVNISQFYPRPGTPAARMPRAQTSEVKRRSRAITDLFYSFDPYSHKVGQRQRVLVTEVSADGKFWVAHNEYFEQVLIPRHSEYMGKMIDVVITETGRFHLLADVLEDSLAQAPVRPTPLDKGAVSTAGAPPTAHENDSGLWRAVGIAAVAAVVFGAFKVYRRIR